MSLIEQALNRAGEEIHSPSTEASPYVVDPRSIVKAPPSQKRHLYLGLGGVVLLVALTLSVWLFFVTPEEFDQPSSGLHASIQNNVASVPSPVTEISNPAS